MRAIACAAAVLGGGCWVVRAFLDGDASDLVWYAGAGLLGLAVLLGGLLLVKRSPLWLKAIVSLSCLGLAVSVYAAVRAEGDAEVLDATAGGAAAVLAVFLVLVRPSPRQPRRHGSHSR